jgi:hypothetical protein
MVSWKSIRCAHRISTWITILPAQALLWRVANDILYEWYLFNFLILLHNLFAAISGVVTAFLISLFVTNSPLRNRYITQHELNHILHYTGDKHFASRKVRHVLCVFLMLLYLQAVICTQHNKKIYNDKQKEHNIKLNKQLC